MGWPARSPQFTTHQPIYGMCKTPDIIVYVKNSIEIYGFTTKQALTYIYYEYYCIFTCEHVLLKMYKS